MNSPTDNKEVGRPHYFLPETTDRVFCVSADGLLLAEDYRAFEPWLEQMAKEQGEIRIVVRYRNFTGWEEEATKIDMGMTARYGGLMRKMAFVNPSPVIMSQMKMKSPVHVRAEVRYFEDNEYADAVAWAEADD